MLLLPRHVAALLEPQAKLRSRRVGVHSRGELAYAKLELSGPECLTYDGYFGTICGLKSSTHQALVARLATEHLNMPMGSKEVQQLHFARASQ